MTFIIVLAVAYIVGSIPCSILLSKVVGFTDPRKGGSKNLGATNVLRVGGKKAAFIVLVADMLKGIIAVGIGIFLSVQGAPLGFVALAAVLGHVFPLFLKFKGGRGVATAAGGILLLSFSAFVGAIIVWLIVVFVSRYVSLASMCGAVSAPIIMLVTGSSMYAFPAFIIAILIIWRHKENIERLRKKEESKIKF
jgi:glycerol-3-phosphate acyltransferase PlsY